MSSTGRADFLKYAAFVIPTAQGLFTSIFACFFTYGVHLLSPTVFVAVATVAVFVFVLYFAYAILDFWVKSIPQYIQIVFPTLMLHLIVSSLCVFLLYQIGFILAGIVVCLILFISFYPGTRRNGVFIEHCFEVYWNIFWIVVVPLLIRFDDGIPFVVGVGILLLVCFGFVRVFASEDARPRKRKKRKTG